MYEKSKARSRFHRCMFSGVFPCRVRRRRRCRSWASMSFAVCVHRTFHSLWKLFWIRSNILFNLNHLSFALSFLSHAHTNSCSLKMFAAHNCFHLQMQWLILPNNLDDTSVNSTHDARTHLHSFRLYEKKARREKEKQREQKKKMKKWCVTTEQLMARIVLPNVHMKHDGMSPHKWKTIISNCLRNVQTFPLWVFCFAIIFPLTHPFPGTERMWMCASWPWTANDTLEKVTLLSARKWKTQQSTRALIENVTWNCFNPPEQQ